MKEAEEAANMMRLNPKDVSSGKKGTSSDISAEGWAKIEESRQRWEDAVAQIVESRLEKWAGTVYLYAARRMCPTQSKQILELMKEFIETEMDLRISDAEQDAIATYMLVQGLGKVSRRLIADLVPIRARCEELGQLAREGKIAEAQRAEQERTRPEQIFLLTQTNDVITVTVQAGKEMKEMALDRDSEASLPSQKSTNSTSKATPETSLGANTIEERSAADIADLEDEYIDEITKRIAARKTSKTASKPPPWPTLPTQAKRSERATSFTIGPR